MLGIFGNRMSKEERRVIKGEKYGSKVQGQAATDKNESHSNMTSIKTNIGRGAHSDENQQE